MTRKFGSKEAALNMGIFYARGKLDLKINDLKRVDAFVGNIGSLNSESEVYELLNSKGETCRISVSPFRDGWDLWLIAPNGYAVRT